MVSDDLTEDNPPTAPEVARRALILTYILKYYLQPGKEWGQTPTDT